VTYLRDRVIGNFKPSTTEKQKAKAAKPRLKREGREGNSEEHLAFIRKLPCCITLRTPCGEAHHLQQTGERGMQQRSTDRWAVPLTHALHMELHRLGSKREGGWFKERGIEFPLDLASRLYSVSPDVAKGTAIVLAYHQKRGKP
jgi:hypothetical protein